MAVFRGGLNRPPPEITCVLTFFHNPENREKKLAFMSINRKINVDPEEMLNRFAKQSR